jgi:hypothetical protein
LRVAAAAAGTAAVADRRRIFDSYLKVANLVSSA